eukprot:6180434-Pleurochrysis_carterae.AAC.1
MRTCVLNIARPGLRASALMSSMPASVYRLSAKGMHLQPRASSVSKNRSGRAVPEKASAFWPESLLAHTNVTKFLRVYFHILKHIE